MLLGLMQKSVRPHSTDNFLGQFEVGARPKLFGKNSWPLSGPDTGATAPFFAVFFGVFGWESEIYLTIVLMGRLSFVDR